MATFLQPLLVRRDRQLSVPGNTKNFYMGLKILLGYGYGYGYGSGYGLHYGHTVRLRLRLETHYGATLVNGMQNFRQI